MGRVELKKGFLATRPHISVAIRGNFVTYFIGVEHLLWIGVFFYYAEILHFIFKSLNAVFAIELFKNFSFTFI